MAGTGGKRDLAITQLAFYSGARDVLKILAHLIERANTKNYTKRSDNTAD